VELRGDRLRVSHPACFLARGARERDYIRSVIVVASPLVFGPIRFFRSKTNVLQELFSVETISFFSVHIVFFIFFIFSSS